MWLIIADKVPCQTQWWGVVPDQQLVSGKATRDLYEQHSHYTNKDTPLSDGDGRKDWIGAKGEKSYGPEPAGREDLYML